MQGWKIDFERKVIYVPDTMEDIVLLEMLNELVVNPNGLNAGPGIKWRIVNVSSNN